MEKKKDQNNSLSKEDMDFIEGRENFRFSKDLILMEMVERYPGLNNGADTDEIIDDFILFVEKNINFPREEVRRRLTKLFSRNCLKIEDREGKTEIGWA